MPYSGTWRCVDLVSTDVSEEYIAPIFRVENSASEEPSVSRWIQTAVCSYWFLARGFLYPEDGGDIFP
jgi:hypothetical protein